MKLLFLPPAIASAATATLVGTLVFVVQNPGQAQPDASWRIHDFNRTRPPMIDPGTASTAAQPGKPPSDATILFDGHDLSPWCSLDGSPAKWIAKDGSLECVKGSGYIRTLQNFGDCQLHVEWAAPVPAQGAGQGRGNSGVFLMGLYEVQVLDSYGNKTYADGQAGAAYGQYPPLVNAARPPGQWQTYDIIFMRPHFDEQGKLRSPARITVLHNGVLAQNNVELTGPTGWMRRAPYQAHADKLPLSLQDHGNPVRYRNIWIRELSHAEQKEFTFSHELLNRYAGVYRPAPDLTITMVREGDQLVAILKDSTREQRFPLFAESKTKFFAKTVDANFTFHANAQGAPESLIFYIGGEERPAKREAP